MTDEYKAARKEVYTKSRELAAPFTECKDSMNKAYYWKAVAECSKQGLGKNIGGGCGHLVSYGNFPMEEVDVSHCEIFKVPIEVIQKYRNELKQQINVQKCKT